MSKEPAREGFREAFARHFGNDAEAFGKRLAEQLIQGNEQFRSAKKNVDRELARGGRSSKGSFRL
nr:hypothetical protein [Sphingobium sp.]